MRRFFHRPQGSQLQCPGLSLSSWWALRKKGQEYRLSRDWFLLSAWPTGKSRLDACLCEKEKQEVFPSLCLPFTVCRALHKHQLI